MLNLADCESRASPYSPWLYYLAAEVPNLKSNVIYFLKFQVILSYLQVSWMILSEK